MCLQGLGKEEGTGEPWGACWNLPGTHRPHGGALWNPAPLILPLPISEEPQQCSGRADWAATVLGAQGRFRGDSRQSVERQPCRQRLEKLLAC